MVQGVRVQLPTTHRGGGGGGDMDIGVGVGDEKRNDEDAATKKMDIKSTPSLIVFRRQTYCKVFNFYLSAVRLLFWMRLLYEEE